MNWEKRKARTKRLIETVPWLKSNLDFVLQELTVEQRVKVPDILRGKKNIVESLYEVLHLS